MVTVLSAIAAALTALYGIAKLIQSALTKTPAEKSKQVIGDVNAALEKAKRTGDTSDLEKLINK